MTTEKKVISIDNDYEELAEKYPKFSQVISDNVWDHLRETSNKAENVLLDKWKQNYEKNIPLLKEHGTIEKDMLGYGYNRAVIGVGAGPSFNINKDLLHDIFLGNLQLSIMDQPSIIACSNHMFKPLLDMKIVPHLVFLVDADENVYDHLCEGIPKVGQHSILVTSLRADHRVIRDWVKQGRHVRFYIGYEDNLAEHYKKITGEEITEAIISLGGNVMNTMFSLSTSYLGSSVYIATGNDLSYPFQEDKEDQRKSFYADGDYSVHKASERDDASFRMKTMGFEVRQSIVADHTEMVTLKPALTSPVLYSYKKWLELNMMFNEERKVYYYNASESGILGVLSKAETEEDRDDLENWYLLDEVVPRYKTCSLGKAANQFLLARRKLIEQYAKQIIDGGLLN